MLTTFSEDAKKPATAKSGIALTSDERYQHDNQALSLQVESLQSQIQEQAKLAKEQVSHCFYG